LVPALAAQAVKLVKQLLLVTMLANTAKVLTQSQLVNPQAIVAKDT
jgi:hypothetical protein